MCKIGAYSMKKANIATLVAALIGLASSSCYVNAPYAYFRWDSQAKSKHRIEKIREELPTYEQNMIERDCFPRTARTYQESMDPNRRPDIVCFCHDPNLPKGYQDYECR